MNSGKTKTLYSAPLFGVVYWSNKRVNHKVICIIHYNQNNFGPRSKSMNIWIEKWNGLLPYKNSTPANSLLLTFLFFLF